MNETLWNEVVDSEEVPSWARPRGPVTLANNRICIGRVGAPPQQEATSNQFAFWIPAEVVVEDTQLVTCPFQQDA